MKMKKLDYYKLRFDVFYDYIAKNQGDSLFLDEVKQMVEIAYKRKSTKDLSEIDKELDMWIDDMLLPSEREDVLQIMSNMRFNNAKKEFPDPVNLVIEKGAIDSDEEYELILQRVESMFNKKGSLSEVKLLNRLLTNYHKR